MKGKVVVKIKTMRADEAGIVTGQITGKHGDIVTCSAVFSPCRNYRYRLTRAWQTDMFANPEKRTVMFLMLNPSTATETQDDRTIAKIQGFAKRWGYNELLIGNLFAWRSSDPDIMKKEREPVGPFNDMHLRAMMDQAEIIVCAWGNDGGHMGRDHEVEAMIVESGKDTLCLGLNNDGTPKHPLYIRNATAPQKF